MAEARGGLIAFGADSLGHPRLLTKIKICHMAYRFEFCRHETSHRLMMTHAKLHYFR
jgi:hypothetical protein